MATPTEKNMRSIVLGALSGPLAKAGITPDDVGDDMNFIEAGILDSLAFLDLVASVEDETGMELDFFEQDPSEFTTLAGFVRCALNSIQSGDASNV